jgi:excinuclease ABC subunit B
VVYVSATPAAYELERAGGVVVEQIIRPTGLVDPELDVRPARGQVADLLVECKLRAERGERVLITALTKRLCEDLTNYLDDQGVSVRYLHSEIETLDRIVILRELREGLFDVLVGVNLLREGLDLPEVSLVCILDADKTGFLRSPTSLIQTIGRDARNAGGKVILYADEMTPALQSAIDETERRRVKQLAYNAEHGITPETIRKEIRRGMEMELRARKTARQAFRASEPEYELGELLNALEAEMLEAAQNLEFEKAAGIRDQITKLKAGKTPAQLREKVKRSEVDGEDGTPRDKKPGAPGTRARKKSRKPTRKG